MATLTGINHIALVTGDMDAFLAFYTDVLGAEVTMDVVETDGMRHAFVDVGGAVLHPFEMPGNPHSAGEPAMFGRGHLDHFAVNVADEESLQELRGRLVDAGASDGTITDFGMVRTVFFVDPDGHHVEVARFTGGAPVAFEDRGVEYYEPAVVSRA